MKRRGFTLIELLTVIGIIAILMTMLVIGIEHLRTNAKRQATAQILASAAAMYSEYDAAMRPSYRNAGSLPCPQNVNNDYYMSVTQSGQSTSAVNPNADRYGNAVLMARDFMSQFRAMPVSASALGKMPADQLGSVPTAAFVAASSWASQSYPVATRVTDSASPPNTYACIQSTSTSPTPPNTSYWIPEPSSTITVPILLDAWGNPIIFVPYSLGSNAALNPDGSIPPGQGILKSGGVTFVQQSPDGRPFFASAGPDGDFSQSDDNIYSFEK